MKDEKNQTFPILGICQGLEVVSIILGDDDIETLSEVYTYGKNHPVIWTTDARDTKLWSSFSEDLVKKMSHSPVGLHAHHYSITLDTFKKKKGLFENMRIT